jgi:DNA-binding NtrC family response regulator
MLLNQITMKQPLIFVVDDDLHLSQVLCSLLRRAGYEAEPFGDGASALRAFYEHAPDLALLDVVLPDITGIEVLRRIRARNASLPVVMMSGQRSVQIAAEAVSLGALDFLEKPLDVHRLRTTIRNALEANSVKGLRLAI